MFSLHIPLQSMPDGKCSLFSLKKSDYLTRVFSGLAAVLLRCHGNSTTKPSSECKCHFIYSLIPFFCASNKWERWRMSCASCCFVRFTFAPGCKTALWCGQMKLNLTLLFRENMLTAINHVHNRNPQKQQNEFSFFCFF